MRTKTNVKAGRAGISVNHNESLSSGLKLKTRVKAGRVAVNHNQTLRVAA